MDFKELAKARYSLRKFDLERPVEKEKLDIILEAARVCPTATNCQCQRVFVIDKPEMLAKLKEAGPYFFDSPVTLLVGYKEDEAWVRKYDGKNHGEQDAAIAATHIILQAADLGLGTCWVGSYDPAALEKAIELPEGVKIICALPLGYPAAEAHPARLHENREPMEHMVTYL